MTPAQDDALKQIENIMSEHFPYALIVVQGELNEDNTETCVSWYGGRIPALGLCDFARRFIHKRNDQISDE